jgi:SAM-dependent methyltransferase
LLPKSQGHRVETVDYADADHLREKYRAIGIDGARIEDVDYVTGGRSILEAIGAPGRYDYIVASHVVEHVPDLVGFLNDCEQLLKPDGRLALAVPDKRRCFDLFQSVSTTGHALAARGRSRADAATAFDFVANFARRGGRDSWIRRPWAEPEFVNGLARARQLYDDLQDSAGYIDIHVWRFVPSSFRLIVSDLHALGEISLRERSFATSGAEFFVTLSRDTAGCGLDRITLARCLPSRLPARSGFPLP